MITALAASAEAVKGVPAYCTSWAPKLDPQQLAACVKAGWQEPTTASSSTGFQFGSSGAAVAVAAIIIVLMLIAATRRGGSRKPATN